MGSHIKLPPALLLIGAIVASLAAAAAQTSAPARAVYEQIDRIFKERAYEAPRFGPARWLPDGAGYAVVERGAKGDRPEIVRYDAATGARTVLVAAERLLHPETKRAFDVDDYAWSADGRRLLVFTNTRRVWRQNTRGDYWVIELAGGSWKKLGGQAEDSSLMFAKFSPDGGRVAYVRANDIHVEGLDDGRIVRLTKTGSETTINGTSDWVYEEELGVRDGFRWSPDGRRIAYWQFDTTGVGIFSLIDNTTALYPTITRIPYPKAGTTNSAVRVGVVESTGGETRWMRLPGDPRQHYVARLDWLDDDTVAVQQLNRLQNRNDLFLASAASGDARKVFRDESRTWVEVMEQVRWIDKGDAFLWMSERDGWQHVYRVSVKDGAARALTKAAAAPNFEATDLLGLDEARGWVYVLASPANAAQRYLYRARLDGSAAPERITPADQPGTHAYDIAPGGRFAFHTWSRFDRPPSIDVVELPGHRVLRALTDPSELGARLAAVLQPPVEFFTVEVDGGVDLDGWMLKPPALDPARKYPVIVFVYGEPAGQTVLDRWGGNRQLFHRALAAAGYIVVSFDNRGTPAPKGAAWRKVIYGTVGDLSSKEQAAAIRAFAARHSFVDASRIGIWGWSGGGTNTLNALFRFPEIYKVGVSVAPVPDQRLYDTIYQERYMGLPQENVAGYRIGSAINFAEGLQGRLLLIHGTGDDNVHYQGSERLMDRLVELGKPFDLMVYPNRTHAIAEGPGTTPHIYRLIARHFLEHLPPQ